jgi:hypothetical protein
MVSMALFPILLLYLHLKASTGALPGSTALSPDQESNFSSQSGKWANPVRPTFFVEGCLVTFLLQQFVVASAATASERRIV